LVRGHWVRSRSSEQLALRACRWCGSTKLQTGAVTKPDLDVAVLPDTELAREDGILGADVFVGRRLVFDIRNRQVRIEPTKRQVRASALGDMRVRNGLLAEIDGKVGSVSARLMLDTGAQNCIANMALNDALLKYHPTLQRVDDARVFGVTGRRIVGQYIALPKVDMRAFTVRDAACVAADAPIFDQWDMNGEPAMIVGVNLLSRLDSFSIGAMGRACSTPSWPRRWWRGTRRLSGELAVVRGRLAVRQLAKPGRMGTCIAHPSDARKLSLESLNHDRQSSLCAFAHRQAARRDIRTALVNWLFAKGQQGVFVLRIDDTDLERSTKENEDGIRNDLTWLGMTWTRRSEQSDKFDRYTAAAEELKAKGLLYPCYETSEELERRKKIAQSRGKPPVYDRAALELTDADRKELESQVASRTGASSFRADARSGWISCADNSRSTPRPCRTRC